MSKYVKCRNCINSCYLLDEYYKPYFWCTAFEDSFDEDREMYCVIYKPKTNAEMLRSMTNKQLANFLAGFSCENGQASLDKILDWLESKMEG